MEDRGLCLEIISRYLDERLDRIILSNSRDRETAMKATIRPVMIKGEIKFQAEELVGKQAFHRNLSREEAITYVEERLERQFRNGEFFSARGQVNVLVGKKGTVTIREKKNKPETISVNSLPVKLSHNRGKQYILREGEPIPFLVKLGVMGEDGAVKKSRYDKFRQINRFLEFIEDILPKLDPGRMNTIIDFGCGKSYLTFAMYHYLKVMKGYPIRIIGLDLKFDVIELCSRLSDEFGFEGLSFQHGDIANFDGVSRVDMVVTLHACDTATDYAIQKAVGWRAKVILSVPCCQHELNGQIESSLLKPVMQYGLIRERMAALLTDGIRAEILEGQGYRTQVLEFIDMEHTPKNTLIRAVYQGKRKDNREELTQMMGELHVKPKLYELLGELDLQASPIRE